MIALSSAANSSTIGNHSQRVTLAHVADKAGVSITTASLILSNRKDYIQQFRPMTVDKVRKSAKRLGYRSNLFAAGLPTKAPAFFALIIRDFGGRQDEYDWHLWAFEGQLLAGAVRCAKENGLYPVLATIDPDDEDAGISSTEKIIGGGVCGTVIRAQNPPLERFLYKQLQHGQSLVVVFPDQISRWSENAIIADNRTIGRQAAQLLIAQGIKSCGIVRYKQRQMRESHILRMEGFNEIAEQAGVKVHTIRFCRDLDKMSDRDLNRLAKMKCGGAFALDSVLSVDTVKACDRIGLKAGEDIQIVGVNASQWRGNNMPRLTSIDISWNDVGTIAVDQLVKVRDGHDSRFESIMIKPEVFAGETCEVPPELSSA